MRTVRQKKTLPLTYAGEEPPVLHDLSYATPFPRRLLHALAEAGDLAPTGGTGRRCYSCGTAPDFDRLPLTSPLHPGSEAPLLSQYSIVVEGHPRGAQALKNPSPHFSLGKGRLCLRTLQTPPPFREG